MEKTIPLVKDVLETYPDVNIDEHLNADMIKMYNDFMDVTDNKSYINYRNDEIYNYIKFINLTCLNTNCYKHVVPYITEDNINFFSDLFNNYDILYELFPLLSYKVVAETAYFNDVIHKQIKDKWICNNMTWIKRYKTELLKPYVVFKMHSKYFLINGVIHSNHWKIDKKIVSTYVVIHDMEYAALEGHLQVVEYIINTFYDILGDYLFTVNISVGNDFVSIFNKTMCAACEGNNINIVAYMIDFMKSKNKLYLLDRYGNSATHPVIQWIECSICDIDIFNYLVNNEDLKPNNNINIDMINNGLLKASKMNDIQTIDFLLEKGGNINYESEKHHKYISYDIKEKSDLLTIAAYYGNYEMVVHLIERGIDLVKYCHKSISYIYNNYEKNNIKIVTHIIDKFANTSKSIEDDENLFCTILKYNNLDVFTYMMSKYYPTKYIEDNFINIDNIISAAFKYGNIDLIKNMINSDSIRNKSNILNSQCIDAHKLVSIIKTNSEELCIGFITFIMKFFKITSILKIIYAPILEGYLELAAIIYDLSGVAESGRCGITVDDLDCSIIHSKSEESCIKFIEHICKNGKVCNKCADIIAYKSCEKGYLNLIKYIFKDKDINPHIHKLLKISISRKKIEIIKYLIDQNIDVPRLEEIWCDNFEINKLFIEKGADVKGIFTHIQLYVESSELTNYLDIIKYIYDEGLISLEDKITYKIFDETCKKIEFVKYFLSKGLKMKEHINNVLEETITCNNIDLVKLLVKNEKDTEYIDPNSEILVKTCENNNMNIFKIFIKYYNLNVHNGKELLYTCINENLKMVVHLIENGADLKINDNKALRISAKYGYIDIVKYLIENGADVSVIDKKYYHKDVDDYLKSLNIKLQFSNTDDDYSSDDTSDSGSSSDSD